MSSNQTPPLVPWLLKQIAATEAVAAAALRDDVTGPPHTVLQADDGRWSTGSHGYDAERIEGIGITIYDEGGHTAEQATHIALHDPASVLATCHVHRAIVESCRADYEDAIANGDDTTSLAEEVMAHLASNYADRDGYDQGWAL